MTRPTSIRYYELCYLASLAISVAITATTWSRNMATEQAENVAALLGTWFMPLAMVFIYTVWLLLWYFTARVASAFAKWTVVVFSVLSILSALYGLSAGADFSGLVGVLTVVATLLNVAALWLLFRPDSSAWFGAAA